MLKINNREMLDSYISKYKIDDIFTKNMRPFMELLLFKKDEYICRENEELKYLLFFLEGKAKVYSSLNNGKSLLLYFYQEFMLIGDLEIFNRDPASTNIHIIEDAYCIGIASEKVRSELLEDPKFLRYICNSLGKKLYRCSKNSAINLLYPLENRLASYILATGENLNESLTEISELLGTSYRHLLRTISNMCDKDLIKRSEFGFEIINREVLTKLASDLYIN